MKIFIRVFYFKEKVMFLLGKVIYNIVFFLNNKLVLFNLYFLFKRLNNIKFILYYKLKIKFVMI